MMKGQKLPPKDHIIRYVSSTRLRRDDEDRVVGVLGAAFQLREGESYLSSTWLEFFDDRQSAIRAIRQSNLKPTKKSGFALGEVEAITKASSSRKHTIRIVHEPEDDNAGHAAVRRFPRDDIELLELLAADAWAELILNVDVPE